MECDGSEETISQSEPELAMASKAWTRKLSSGSSEDDSDEDSGDEEPPTNERVSLQLLSRLVADATPTLQQIEGKDVVVILGNTGTGKSTLIHVLAGQEICERSYKLADGNVEKTVYEAVEPLEGFAIGHSQKSQTKHIMHYVRTPRPLLDREVVFLDSAGFGDTSGMEVDIATAISLSKLAQVCCTLRFVVLISCTSLSDSRGGAIRALVRLMSRLVGTAETEDFDKLRYVFTFLFTHTGALNDYPCSEQGGDSDAKLKQMSRKIQSLLKDIRKGTDHKEPAVRAILKWISDCLEQEHPCAGVFHPKLTSGDWLLDATAMFAETEGYYTALGMEEGKRPQDDMKYGVTQEHEHAIKLEVEQLEKEFNMHLEHDQVDLLRKVRDNIQFLFSNVELQCVKHVHARAATRLHEKIFNLERKLCELIESSTDDKVTMTGKAVYNIPESSGFEAQAARIIPQALQIQALSSLRMGDNSMEQDADEGGDTQVHLCARLRRLAEMVTEEPSIWKVLMWVEKLNAWAQADHDARFTEGLAQELTVDARQVLNDGVANLLANCNTTFTGDHTLDAQKCAEFAGAAVHLEGLLIHRSRLEKVGVRALELDDPRQRMEQKLEDMLAFHVKGAQNALRDQNVHTQTNSQFEPSADLGAHVLCLDTLTSSFVDAGAQYGCVVQSKDLLRKVLDEIGDQVEEHATAVGGTSSHDARSGPVLHTRVAHMKSLVSVLGKVCCEEREHCKHTIKLYDGTLEMLELSLKKQQVQLEYLCNQMRNEVLTSPTSHAQLLSTLWAFAWMDDFLHPESQHFSSQVEKFKEDYLLHHEHLCSKCLEHLREYLQSPTERCTEFSMLQARLSEANKLASICRSPFPDVMDKDKGLADSIGSSVREWCLEQDKLITCPDTLEHFNSFPSEAANSALKACEDLQKLKPTASRISELYNKLIAWLKKATHNINSLFEQNGHYTLKHGLLDTLLHWQGQGLSHLTAQLPPLADLQATVGTSVAAQASHLRSLIYDTPDSDIAEELKDVEEACCLDHHIHQRASTELHGLKQLVEVLRAGLDSALTNSIQEFCFDNVQHDLQKLSTSADAQNKLRFQNLRNVVECAVKSKIAIGNQRIAQGPDAARTYKLLQNANKCVGRFLTGVSTSDALNNVRDGVHKHVTAMTNQLQSAHNDLDHPQIVRLAREVKMYIQCTGHLLDNTLKNTAHYLLNKEYKLWFQFKTMVERRLNVFGEEKCDTTNLHIALRKWQRFFASERFDPEDTTEYHNLMRYIGESLNNQHALLMNNAQVDVLWALGVRVYAFLHNEWEKGLKNHKIVLQFNIQDMLAKCRQSEQRADALGEKYFLDVTNKCWVSELDYLSAATLQGFLKRDAYEHRKKALIKLILKLVEDVRHSLDSRDYASGGHVMDALTHRRNDLHYHIKDHVKVATSFLNMDAHVLKCRVNMEHDLTALLDGHCITEFGTLFREYFKYMKVFGVSAHSQCFVNKTLLESMYSSVEKCLGDFDRQLEAFEYAEVTETVQMLRTFSVVLAGDFADYTEECTEVLKGKENKWLNGLDELQHKHLGGAHLKTIAKHYSVLELDQDATEKDVSRAFQRLSLKCHPDKPGGSNEKMHVLIEAKEALCDAGVRERYQDMVRNLFSPTLCKAMRTLDDRITTLLDNSRYKCVHGILQNLESYHLMVDLVPELRSKQEVQAKVHELVKRHVGTIQEKFWLHWDSREFKKLQDCFTRLASIDSNLSSFSSMNVSEWVRSIRKSVEEEIGLVSKNANSYLKSEKAAFANIKDFALQLVHLGRILDDLPRFKSTAAEEIHNLLQTCQEWPSWGVQFLFKLSMELQRGTVGTLGYDGKVTTEDQRIGRLLVSEFKQFGEVVTSIWNLKVTQQDISSIIDEIISRKVTSGSRSVDAPIDKDVLLQGFKQYEEQYNKWFNRWYAGNSTLEDIAQSCMADATNIGLCRTDMWTWEIRQKIPCLLGGIFAYFTIFRSGQTYKRMKPDGANGDAISGIKHEHVLLIKPHSIQVLSILRMLGCDVNRNDKLVNHLMQIRTGEGKSMILGACCVVLGLLGFNVRCICYSKYLSNRDFLLFEEIFSAFGVKSCIMYSTIDEYCNNKFHTKGDICELTRNLLHGNLSQARYGSPVPNSRSPADSNNSATLFAQEILLVDEVDVFYGRNYYGKTLDYMAWLRTPEVKTMLKSIWDGRSKFASWDDHKQAVMKSTAYTDLRNKHPAWKDLLEHEVGRMCRDVSEFVHHKYDFDRALNRVGYKRMDSMDYHTCKGYLTAFAYLNEAEKRNMRNPEQTLDDRLGLQVRCGYHLYSDINPACILGVSGTVEALGKYEWDVMNKYNISIYTRMPSVYGQSNFHFLDQDGEKQLVVASKQDDYFREITDAAMKAVAKGRAVIVFFAENQTLQDYASSSYYAKLEKKATLDEKLSHEEKDHIVKKAATSKQVTFTTAVFGRGTDFQCFDDDVLQRGGVHIVQTFLSESKMEEIQIQGRTARQGAQGTYSMVLLEDSLKTMTNGITAELACKLNKSELYNRLDKSRQEYHDQACKYVEESFKSNEVFHKLTHKYFDALLSGNQELAFESGKSLWCK